MTQRFDDAGAPASGSAGVTEWDFHAIVFGTAAGARTPGLAPPAPSTASAGDPEPAPAGHRFDRLESPPSVLAAVRGASSAGHERATTPAGAPAPATRPVPIVSAAAAQAEIEIATRPAAPRSHHDPHWLLRLLDGSEHPLDGTVLLGRAPRAGAGEERIIVPDEQSGVSRTHARLSLRGGLLTIEDLGSTNGTYLVDEAGVETRCPPHEPIPVPLGWGVDLANVPLVLWAPGR
jgi:hypothetical protein